MSTYAVGDVQGCYRPLRDVLRQAGFSAGDTLWMVGDLVSRGPDSLDVLRFVRDLGDRVVVVLGNHDLHLLAIHHGIRDPKPKEYLEPLLAAPDREELIEWLARRRLMHHDRQLGYSMVHAGLHPAWTIEKSLGLAAEVEAAMRGGGRRDFLRAMYGDEPASWHDDLQGAERLRVLTNYLTRMRICDARGQLDLRYKQDETAIPAGYMPWYDVPGRASAGQRIVFGHWAALQGRANRGDVDALDTGCVWGGPLTLLRLDDRRFFRAQS